jgi:hypothetical protein
MRGSPTAALLWEIWSQHRSTIGMIAGLTVMGRVVEALERQGNAAAETSTLTTLLAMVAFLLFFTVFNYTESGDGRGVGGFPRRLFTLPVTSLRLVAVPMLAGIISIEILYLLWMGALTYGGYTTTPFVVILLATLVVFYLSALWILERAGSLRLVIHGAIAIGVFAIAMLPSFPPTPAPSWRSEVVLGGLLTGLAAVAFVLTWRHVARLRAGGSRSAHRAESLFNWIAEAAPTRRRAFVNPTAAHFWFEWRASGMVLPALVGGLLLGVVMPVSWLVRGNPNDTFRLLIATLAVPVFLAVPVGIAFSKPTFWSEDLAIPPFVAVLPLSSEDLVAIKVKVAAMSTLLSWLGLLLFVTVWLSSWGSLDTLSRLALQLWAFHGQSVAAVYGIAVLVAFVGIFLTWRFLVSRLWSGLSGMRTLFLASVSAIVILVIVALVFDADRLPGWVLGDPARLAPVVWIASVAVIAKCWIAAYAWRNVPPRYLRAYLLIWLAGTTAFLTLGLVLWGMLRIYLPVDVDRLRSVVVLFALLAMPLARMGLAPSSLARNRHRS